MGSAFPGRNYGHIYYRKFAYGLLLAGFLSPETLVTRALLLQLDSHQVDHHVGAVRLSGVNGHGTEAQVDSWTCIEHDEKVVGLSSVRGYR